MKKEMFLCCCLMISLATQAQINQTGFKNTQTLISNWPGWLNKPDTVRVFVDSTFTDAEKDSAKVAAKRWNDAGGKPSIKIVTSTPPPAQINMTTNKNLGNHCAGLTSYTQDPATMKVTGCKVQINDRSGHAFTGEGHKIGITEVITHELGHCLGMAHTKAEDNPDDCMKDVDSNGKGGTLSKHDSSEVTAAAKFWNGSNLKKAIDPQGTIIPGSGKTLTFDLVQIYPDPVAMAAVVQVHPVSDPYVTVLSSEVFHQFLYINVLVAPQLWQGQLFLDINIAFQDPGFLPVSFLGWQYVDPFPVPPTAFECPFTATFENGHLVIYWENQCTYPYPEPVKSQLKVDNTVYFLKGSGPYILDVAIGTHVVTLEVDDFQGNVAASTQTITFTGIKNELPDNDLSVVFSPNPFRECTNIEYLLQENTQVIVVVYNHLGEEVGLLVNMWQPKGLHHVKWDAGKLAAGVYYCRIQAGKTMETGKIVKL